MGPEALLWRLSGVATLDNAVGHVPAGLKELGLVDNTVVFF